MLRATNSPHRRIRRVLASALALVLTGGVVIAGTTPAVADVGDPQYLTVDKRVSADEISVDEPFTYTIEVNCSEATCLDAHLQDQFPAELDGYALQNVTITPSASSVPREVTWTVDGAETSQPSVLTDDTVLDIDFQQEGTNPEGTGLEFGTRVSVSITLQAPEKTPGEYAFTNTATTEASNSNPDSSDATTTLVVPSVLDVDVTKDWDPAEETFTPGAESTISLGVTNTSNGPVETLTLQEPQNAPDGATSLDPSNPFTLTDLAGPDGFSASMPPGAEQAQVDVYVLQSDGSYGWETGTPDATPALPVGVDPGDVAGIRITYTGAAIERQASSAVELDLALRETHRDTGEDLSVDTHTVDNTTVGSAAVADRDPATATADASYTVTPPALGVETSKNISPSRIAAGDSAEATLTGTNASDIPVAELRLADLDYFTADLTFDGFTAAPSWPAGATGAEVIYHPLDGSDPVSVPFADGETPAAPAEAISGFELVFTADAPGIEPAASTSADFMIGSTEAAVSTGETLPTTNTVDASITTFNDRGEEASDDANLTLVAPAVDVELTKTIRPGATVRPGEDVVTELRSNLTTTSDYVTATQIVVEDSSTGDGGFWDAFNVDSVAPTQVPSNTDLTVEVQLPDGSWTSVAVFDAQASPFLASLSQAEIAAALPGGVTTEDLTGIRFIFDNTDGFAADTTVTPYVVSTARDELRSGGEITEDGVDVENLATTTGTGETEAGTPLTDTDEDVDSAGVAPQPGGPGPGVGIDKSWDRATIPAQTDQQAGTTLSWRVSPGFEQVVVSDPAAPVPGDVSDTVYDAFDLVQLDPIAGSDEPYSNGWFLKYDTITAVELYDGTSWQTVAEPADGWQSNGAFVGYTLTTDEQVSTVAMRVVLEENTAAREAAATAGDAYDPYAPTPGTGVATSSVDRTFDQTWRLRDQLRSDGSWITDEAVYNAGEPGVVDNTTSVTGTPIGGDDPVTDSDNAVITITTTPPGVQVGKSVDPTSELYVPMEGTTEPGDYPTATFTLTARNDSVTPASYVRLMDPPACTDAENISVCQSEASEAGALADPFTADIDWLREGSPFDRFTLTGLDISAGIADQVDLAESVVWLLHEDGTTSQVVAEDANDLTAPDLADVIGLSVTYAGADLATITSDNTLSVVLETQLRTTLRSTGEQQLLSANDHLQIPNRVFAQSYDPLLNDGALTGANASAAVGLTGGDINVAPSKSVSPDALTEPTRDEPVTVTLGADQGNDPVSTLAPAEVRLTDDVTTSPDFWNTFDLTGLGEITAPDGADQVAIDVYGPFGTDGELEWTSDAPTGFDTAALPDVDLTEVQGVRFAFSRADGEFFSDDVPAPGWSANAAFTVQLREDYRDSGEAVQLEGEVTNTVTVISDRLNGESSEAKAAAAVVGLSEGTAELEVNKLANDGNRTATVGDLVPWDLTVHNSGTGYLDLTEVRDALPEHLAYLGDEPTYTADDEGALSEDVTLTQEGEELVFTWPEGGNRMLPGETFTIRVLLELQPGLSSGERTTNTMVASTVQTLERCENVVSGGSTTDDWASDATTCGATDYVQPAQGTNLYTLKGVRGELEGAHHSSSVDRLCEPTLTATGGDYYRAPCAANSVIGGTDDWVLQTVNAGTTDITEMVVFDQLPVAGDLSLVAGSDRGSVYRPQLLDNLLVTAPEGTETVIEVTTSDDVCVGTWSEVTTAEPCTASGEEWTELTDGTDLSQVSGLRIWLDFSATADGALVPGQGVDVTYSSENVPATDVDPSGAPVEVPVTDTYAWNQFGVKYQVAGEDRYERLAPSPVGVHLRTGSLEVVKDVTGPAAGYAAQEFLADLVCTVEGAPLDMGEYATLTLTDGESVRVDGIPLGSECVVTEQGEVGEFGETSREPGSVTLDITEMTGTEDEVPAAHVGQLGNDFQYADLSVTKNVDTQATSGELGPFDFTLTCTTALGAPVDFGDGATELAFTLADGETFDAPAGTIPVGAECVLTEADAAQDEVVIVGTNVTDNGDGSATIGVDVTGAEVEVTNGYDAGVLSVAKVAEGDGADLYGAGPFGFEAVCTYDGQTLLEESFELAAGAERSFGTYPAGTECAVTETATGGANATALEPADGAVTIVGPETDEENVGMVGVTATNTFVLGEVAIEKLVDGPGAELYGAGPFTAQAVCAWDRDGEQVSVELPNDGHIQLNAANGYAATIGDLLVGTDCVVTEVADGGATATQILPADGVVTVGEEPAVVTLTNTFDVTSLTVTKQIEGEPAGEASFAVTLVCTWTADGEEREVEIPGGAVRELQAPDDLTVTYEDLPIGADCVVNESETGGADATTIAVSAAGEEVTTEGDSAELTTLADAGTTVTVTNVFDPEPGAGDGDLPGTGTEPVWWIAGAALLMLAGGILLGVRRRQV
ncbi:DUF5979 domain-containing protein [Ruania rhizosphaerae]|uniref:DUF5979 domain-containing protein n=1 Tax=Ruania rhizosphaerae TaxID=1840413 RepID=UPI0013568DE3|nr:DUF5979 domain-containing protein [Ruania rhizosphaerae]